METIPSIHISQLEGSRAQLGFTKKEWKSNLKAFYVLRFVEA